MVVSQACRLRRLWPHRLPTAGLPHAPLSVDFFPRLAPAAIFFQPDGLTCYHHDASFTICLDNVQSGRRYSTVASPAWPVCFLISVSFFFSLSSFICDTPLANAQGFPCYVEAYNDI